jgi:hypothetical protein
MVSTLKVPAMIVGELRAGLCSILGQAAWDVSTVMNTGCACHPRRVEDLLRRMDCARALLELIGWTQTVKPETVFVDLGIHRWAFVNGLERALVVGCENIDPVGKADKDSREQTDENKRDRDVVRFLVLRQYLDDVEIKLTTPDIAASI